MTAADALAIYRDEAEPGWIVSVSGDLVHMTTPPGTPGVCGSTDIWRGFSADALRRSARIAAGWMRGHMQCRASAS